MKMSLRTVAWNSSLQISHNEFLEISSLEIFNNLLSAVLTELKIC